MFKNILKKLASRNSGLNDRFGPRGHFEVEHLDKNGKLLGKYRFKNSIVDVGATALLNSYFNNTSPPATWYLALVDNAGWTAFSNSDTMGSHTGWTEAVGYSGGARPAWGNGSASARSITNGTAVTFTMTGSATIKGIFVTTNNSLSGTTGTLWSEASFSSTVTVNTSDQLKVTYTIND